MELTYSLRRLFSFYAEITSSFMRKIKGGNIMIILTVLAILLALVIAFVVVTVIGGTAIMLTYLDVIIAILLIWFIIHHFIKKRK